MKNLKTYVEFISEANAPQTLNFLSSEERRKGDINQGRKTPPNQQDQRYQDKTKKQALIRTDELDKELDNVGQQQQDSNNKMEDIKLKQDLLPDDKNKRDQFLNDIQTDLKGIEGNLNNAEKQRLLLQQQKDRIQKNFIKK